MALVRVVVDEYETVDSQSAADRWAQGIGTYGGWWWSIRTI